MQQTFIMYFKNDKTLVFCVSEYNILKIVSTIIIVDFFIRQYRIFVEVEGKDIYKLLAYLIISCVGSYNRLIYCLILYGGDFLT